MQIRNGPGSDSSCKPSVVPSLEAPVRILSRVRPLCGASQAGATLPFSTMWCTSVGTSSTLALRHCTNLRASAVSVAAGQMHNIVGHHNSIAGT